MSENEIQKNTDQAEVEKGSKLSSFFEKYKKWISISSSVAVLFFVIGFFTILPPIGFSEPVSLIVEKGMSVKEVGQNLKDLGVIKSKTTFNVLIQISDQKTIGAGLYVFDKPQNIFRIAERMKNSEYGVLPKIITLTEGMTVAEMADFLEQSLENFVGDDFLEIAAEKEGYLFPDTYKFSAGADAEEVFETLADNFEQKIDSIKEEIEKSPYSLEEIVIMASIVEKEATADTRIEVANILWKRIEIDLALQVDAPFVYVIGKGTFDLTLDDLRNDHEYNTYTRKGLIPGPISNPGLESILAAANPQPTKNLYFLTGRDGGMYFAQTFEGHKRNRALYLD